MSEYQPDRWEVMEITTPEGETIRKVFGSWYGGYTNGDSWRASSGITGVRYEDDLIHFDNHSGSVYTVHKSARGMSAYSAGVYNSFVKEMNESTDGRSIKLVGEKYAPKIPTTTSAESPFWVPGAVYRSKEE